MPLRSTKRSEIGVIAHFLDLVPQGGKILKSGGFVLGLTEQGGRVEGAHEGDAALFGENAVFLGHRKAGPNHPLGRNPAQAYHDFGPQNPELFPQPGHAGFALVGQRVAVLGRPALDDVGDIAVFGAVQIDGKQVFVQQLAAASHKGQTLFVLALAGALAYKQDLGVFHALSKDNVLPGLAQRAAGAGQALGLQGRKIHEAHFLSGESWTCSYTIAQNRCFVLKSFAPAASVQPSAGCGTIQPAQNHKKGENRVKFHTFGDERLPHILMIHGGGNAWWNYLRQARALSPRYHVILPTLDGHGEEFATPYVSTEKTADQILEYIDSHCGGHLFALCGVSLGGQIVMELLSRRADLAQKAIIDGSLCIPQPALGRFCIASVRLFGRWMFSERACRWQLALMPKMLPEKMCYPEEIQAHYMEDMPRLPMETLYTMYRTYMMHYRLKDSIRNTRAQVMYWYGEKEMKCVKRSAQLFRSMVPSCTIREAKGYGHGYLSVYLPEEWLQAALPFLEGKA